MDPNADPAESCGMLKSNFEGPQSQLHKFFLSALLQSLQKCGYAVGQQHFFKKLRICSCRSGSCKLQNCVCGHKKKLCLPTPGDRTSKINFYNKQRYGMFSVLFYCRDKWNSIVFVDFFAKTKLIFFCIFVNNSQNFIYVPTLVHAAKA
jgi:hypothetical protein